MHATRLNVPWRLLGALLAAVELARDKHFPHVANKRVHRANQVGAAPLLLCEGKRTRRL